MAETVTELDAREGKSQLSAVRGAAGTAWRYTTAPARLILGRFKQLSGAIGPILNKELRVAARRKRTFLLRTVYVGFLTATVSVALYEASNNIRMNPGLTQLLIGQIAPLTVGACGWFQLIAGALIAPVLTSTTIAEERTRRTLRMLLITPISPWHIVVSKLLAPAVQLLLLIAASLPVLAIVQVYGGVGLGVTLGITVLCLANALFAASVGLVISTYPIKLFYATPLSYLALLGCYALLSLLGPVSNPFWAMQRIAEGILAPKTAGFELQWWLPCTIFLLLGTLWMTKVAAWRLQAIATNPFSGSLSVGPTTTLLRESRDLRRQLETDRAPRLPFARIPKNLQLQFEFLPLERPKTGRNSRRVADNPIVWREGNRLRSQMKGEWVTKGVPIYLGLALLMSLVARHAFANPLWHGLVTGTFLAILLLATALLAAPSITTEKETGCWRALLSTPLSPLKILRSKAWAVLQHVYPASLFALGHVVLFTVLWNLRAIVLLHALLIVVASVMFALSLALVFSLRVRRTTTAVLSTVLTALALWCAVPLAAGIGWGGRAAMSTLLINPVFLMGAAAFGATRDMLPRTQVVYFVGEVTYTPLAFTLNVLVISGGYLVLAACLFASCLLGFNARQDRTS